MNPLNIAVCIKPVPDPKESSNLKIDPVSKTLVRKGIPLVINPLDKHALEAALELKEASGGRCGNRIHGPAPTLSWLWQRPW